MSQIPAELDTPIGHVVKAWRVHRRLSSTALAKAANVPKGYLSELEHNKIAQPGKTRLAQLAGALEVSVWDLWTRRMPPGTASEAAGRSVSAGALPGTPAARAAAFGAGVGLGALELALRQHGTPTDGEPAAGAGMDEDQGGQIGDVTSVSFAFASEVERRMATVGLSPVQRVWMERLIVDIVEVICRMVAEHPEPGSN